MARCAKAASVHTPAPAAAKPSRAANPRRVIISHTSGGCYDTAPARVEQCPLRPAYVKSRTRTFATIRSCSKDWSTPPSLRPIPAALAQWYVDHLEFNINFEYDGNYFVKAANGAMLEIIPSEGDRTRRHSRTPASATSP